jgi:hypothetical protein
MVSDRNWAKDAKKEPFELEVAMVAIDLNELSVT